ncbi:MAG TPA: hypothetical protein VMV29_24160, partial [Ktedonobacterales bacterium]|nr:hypothetical protein [Ktedonobacterales bacterium]
MTQVVAAQFLPAAAPIGVAQTFSIGTRNATWLRIRNESPYQLTVDTQDGNTHELGAWEINLFPMTQPTSSVMLTVNPLNTSQSGSPSNFLSFQYFLPQDGTPTGQYPVSLNRLTNVGNAVVVSNANTLVNTGQPGSVNVITIEDLSNIARFLMDNHGNATWQTDDAGVQRTVLSTQSGGAIANSTVIIGDAGDVGMTTL